MIVSNLRSTRVGGVDINFLPEHSPIASARTSFDDLLMIESGILTHEEVDRMRPMLHRHLARELEDNEGRCDASRDGVVRFIKTHDGYSQTSLGEPLLGGPAAAGRAIVIVRDPRDVAASLANHLDRTIDDAIAFMANPRAAFSNHIRGQVPQLRQLLKDWSAWQSGWLCQTDVPIHMIRYEDMQTDPFATVRAALVFANCTFENDALARAIDLSRFDRLKDQEGASGFHEAPATRTFFRQGRSGAWRQELTTVQVAAIERDHGILMERLGYYRTTGSTPGGSEDQR